MTHDIKQRWDDSGLARALKFWPIILSGFFVVQTVITSTQTINVLDKRMEQEEKLNDAQEERITKQEQSTVDIKRRLDRMEDKLDAILRAVK